MRREQRERERKRAASSCKSIEHFLPIVKKSCSSEGQPSTSPSDHTPNGRGESRYPPRSPGIDQITEYIWGKLVTLLSSSFSSSAHYLAWRYAPIIVT